jgi:hypothetical protein
MQASCERLRGQLAHLRDTAQQLTHRVPLLHAASSRIDEWPKLGSAGLQALDYLAQAHTAPVEWQNAQNALLKQAVQHEELVDFAVLPMIENWRTPSARPRLLRLGNR